MAYGKRSSRLRPHDAVSSSRVPSVAREHQVPCRPTLPEPEDGEEMSQPCPDLAMAFAMEWAGRQHGTDRCRQRIVGLGPRRRLVAIYPGSGKPPDPADCRQAIRLSANRRK